MAEKPFRNVMPEEIPMTTSCLTVDAANLLSFVLLDDQAAPPRVQRRTMRELFSSLRSPNLCYAVLGSLRRSWVTQVAISALNICEVNSFDVDDALQDEQILSAELIKLLMVPLRASFLGFKNIILLIETYNSTTSYYREFVSNLPQDAAGDEQTLLVYVTPRFALCQLADPMPMLQVISRSPTAPPLAIVATDRDRPKCVAKEVSICLIENIANGIPSPTVAGSVMGVVAGHSSISNRPRKLLHISDLHFGLRKIRRKVIFLKAHFSLVLKQIDRVVITGDLFDNPKASAASEFDSFRQDIERMTADDVVVIPGNHDMRRNGNVFTQRGRKLEELASLRWSKLIVDHENKCLFFCFNSSLHGKFARGRVDEEQRLEMAALFEARLARNPGVSQYQRIALVHHHPYSVLGVSYAWYERFIGWLGSDVERFDRMEQADAFMFWCAQKGVDIVLHGHKHVQGCSTGEVAVDGNRYPIAAIGCGTTTGASNASMTYNIVSLCASSGRWGVEFYEDKASDGNFRASKVLIDFRAARVRAF
jgi:predicted phosphodiesterase